MNKPGSRVILSHDLGEFFRGEISEARASLGLELSDLTEYYMVNLLCDFARQESAPAPSEEPLALLYKKALESGPSEKVAQFKGLGDVALYVSGFFTEFIDRSLVDIDYYISMGGSAYSKASQIVGNQRHGETFGTIYYQLAQRFTELVDLLNQIAERARENVNTDTELLKLYDRWARTGSERIRRLLLERGLVPPEGLPTEYVQ